MQIMEHSVVVRELVKTYGTQKAVKGVSFEIGMAEIFGLIGPNGAGKTTILRVISTLLQITSGSVNVFEYDISRDASDVRKLISYLPEEAGAYKNLTGKGYLEFIASFYSTNTADKIKMVNRGIEIAQLGKRIDDKSSTYSKGMTRRLLVARALMVNPKLAILDEPTSGLDVINSQEIRGLIKEFVENKGTVLLSSHNMLEIELLCDRIALINDGLILEIGTPEELKLKYKARNIEEVFVSVVK
ncbi:MAG: ABC transporter ATP-binding protein [Candidatus Stahlbacteria bacterium]|nr:ABC transporter ATP-binding protein [Candidatus Stahlbacteria bacterium]